MSIETAFARIAELNSLVARPAAAATAPATSTTSTSTSANDNFARLLRTASANGATPTTALDATAALAPAAAPAGNSPAARMVALAQGEVGQAEQPPGSNDSARIATYRTATAGSGVGPWCAYFTSWLARNAGVPVGDHGEGFGSVDALYAWAQRSGRAIPTSSGQQPRAGDLIVWDEHIGIVESVLPDGRIQTIEGNSSDRVSRRVHRNGDAIGYARLG